MLHEKGKVPKYLPTYLQRVQIKSVGKFQVPICHW